jgi:hypothetical protein
MPHLCEFHLNNHMFIDDFDPNDRSINQFTSPFWIERQWFFELKHELGELIYSIHPYRYFTKDIF